MPTKNIRKTRPKHCKTSAKHRKTLFFLQHSHNTTKHPQNTRKTPQNTAKHHKTHLLTKQTELANKPLRSPRATCDCGLWRRLCFPRCRVNPHPFPRCRLWQAAHRHRQRDRRCAAGLCGQGALLHCTAHCGTTLISLLVLNK